MSISSARELTIVASAALFAAMLGASVSAGEQDQDLLTRAQGMFKPLPADAGTPERPVTPERVALGRALFFENRVSTDGRVSCAACHLPSFYGSEPLPRTVGNQGKLLP